MLIIKAQELGTESQYPKFIGGQYACDQRGRLWVYVQGSAAMSFGNAVAVADYTGIDAVVDAAAAVNTRRVTGTGDFTTAALVGMQGIDENHIKGGHMYQLFIDANTGISQGGYIFRRVDDDNVDVYWATSDDGKIATALDATSEYLVWTLSRVAKTATVIATQVIGYVQIQAGTTDEYWFWVLAEGQGYALIDTTDTAIAIDTPLVAGTDVGTLQGADTTAAAEAFFQIGIGVMDVGSDGIVPIIAKAGMNIAPHVLPGNLSTAYPGARL